MKKQKINTNVGYGSVESGITLIALIITIILMLILASITINVALNSGLFGYARKAKNELEKSEDIDKLTVEYYKWSMEKNATLAQVLGNKFGVENVFNNGDNTVDVIMPSGIEYTVGEDGSVVEVEH